MANKRKQYSAEFKFQMALEAAKELKTINQLASEQGLHPNQISHWKQQLLSEGRAIFSDKRQCQGQEQASRETELYEQIGRLKMELEWLKKKVARYA
jgi:transposase-like protein